MDDRKLIEMAAKAVGWRVASYSEHGTSVVRGGVAVVVGEGRNFGWRPLADDGDALRLAVKCRIEFYEGAGDGPEAWAGYYVSDRQKFACEPHGDDPYAATRRAIVRAAAEIGRNKEQGDGVGYD